MNGDEEMGGGASEHKADIKPRRFGRTESGVKQPAISNGCRSDKWYASCKSINVSIPPARFHQGLRPKHRERRDGVGCDSAHCWLFRRTRLSITLNVEY